MRRGRGATLVEAVLGMAILGTLLVATLVTASRLEDRSSHARERGEACRIADRLLETWWQNRDKFPRSGEGPVPGQTGWRWRARVVESDEARAINKAQIVAVELFHSNRPGAEEPAVRIELLLPETQDEKAGVNAG